MELKERKRHRDGMKIVEFLGLCGVEEGAMQMVARII